MPLKTKSVIHVKSFAQKYKIPVRIVLLLLSTFLSLGYWPTTNITYATSCPNLKIIFARGSGGKRYTNEDYIVFKNTLENKLKTSHLTYEFDDLDYPAISINTKEGHLGTLLGAYFGGGDAYDFGESVKKGAKKLSNIINNNKCSNTKYVLAGYSQGAIVVLNALDNVDPNKITYAATFGDPKIYLPEGRGFIPAACSGKNLSSYRIYVPDCRAHKGILGAKKPYIKTAYNNKFGTWCNKHDIICSSHYIIQDHTHYIEDDIYESASRYIFGKIAADFGFKNPYTSLNDVAILINSTPPTFDSLLEYTSAANELAYRILEFGGRVAIYDYHGSGSSIIPTERCNFDSCHSDNLKIILDDIIRDAHPQNSNPLLSSSLHTMRQLNWRFGATKSLVIFTNDNYQTPDANGTKFYDVYKLSRQIDPVNFYIVTNPELTNSYQSLTDATAGAVISTEQDMMNLPDKIVSRLDFLPQVEEEYEDENYNNDIPTLEINETKIVSNSEVSISFSSTGTKTIVILNDAILGITSETKFHLTEIKDNQMNTITLVPLNENRRGEPVSIPIKFNKNNSKEQITPNIFIPKAPNTGRQQV
ncbi:cutinase family protein [Candidatus Saccharibacteria bacterium]|nr:cutinase family protein [Candidatus Saccharibacteria bacterium]